MNTSKRLTTLLLTFCLVLSMAVPPVYAAGTGITPVEGTVACKDAVTSVNCLLAATGQVNGHDYVYLFFNGGMMYVYDLDTDAIIDTQSNCFNTPQSVYIDSSNIVWVTGAKSSLYRYDPTTKAGEMISMRNVSFPNAGSFNAFGLTGDSQGNLYFGTYNTAYLGKYDIDSNTFYRLGNWLSWSTETNAEIENNENKDAQRAGDAGLIYKDGYIYVGIDGNKNNDGQETHQIIKVNATTGAVVDGVDISEQIGGQSYLDKMALVGDLILASSAKTTNGSIAIDISGEKMELITDIPGLETGFSGAISPVIGGKVYMMSNNSKGLLEYDVAQQKVTASNVMTNSGALQFSDCLVTLDSNADMPGQSLLTFVNTANAVDLVLYNLQSKKTVTLKDVTNGKGSGNSLRAIEVSPDGQTVFVSAYGCNHLSVYDVASGKVKVQYPTINTQIEGIILYEDTLYIGNYSSCTASILDLETGAITKLAQLGKSPFSQYRIHATAAGDGKVFFGTAPSSNRWGGCILWYDIAAERVYVAGGPNLEDVYYTPSGKVKDGSVSNQEWYSVTTGNVALTDSDSKNITNAAGESVQRFTGVVTNQTVNCMVYKDGLIYGCTTKSGGSSANAEAQDDKNACLFVYDVNNMELVATYDLVNAIPSLEQADPIPFVDVIAEDPTVPGKFWGVVSDTLFSFTYNAATGFTVNEELSFGTTKYNNGSNAFQSRELLFDSHFMYVVFGSYGTYMISKDNPQEYYKLSNAVPKVMVQAADNNLYYHDNTTDLKVLSIADQTQPIKDPYEAADTQALINALDDKADITLEDEPAVVAARNAYDALSPAGKALVTSTTKLTEAEEVIAPLRAAADQAAAESVIAQIAAIGTVTLESAETVAAARAAYDALTSSQKVLVTNASVLIAAEEHLAALQEAESSKEEIYNFDYLAQTHPNHGSTTLLSEAGKYIELHYNGTGTYKSVTANEKLLNWKFLELSSSDHFTAADFTAYGYFRSRNVKGAYVAFIIDSPGQGIWELSMTHVLTKAGAKNMRVYILPMDKADNISNALVETNDDGSRKWLVGEVNCYGSGSDTPNGTTKPINWSEKEDANFNTWTAGNDETYILVFESADVAENDTTYLYFTSLTMTRQPEVAGTAMTLGNSLSMDFVVASANVEDSYYAEITRDNTTVTVPRSEWKTYDQHGDYLYFSYTGIAAKEMCEEVTVNIYDSQGNQVFETYTDSIRSYAMRMLERADVIADEKLRTLYVDMLNYGAEAQKYWHYNENDLANAQLTSQQKGYATANVTTHNNQTAGAGYLGAALTLENQILLDFVFQGMDYQNFTAVVSYTDHYGNEKTASIPGSAFKVYQTGASYYVSVDTLVVADWQQVVTCTVKNGETVVASVSDSIESYIHRQLEKETLTDIVGAIAKFGQSANAYFHQKKE